MTPNLPIHSISVEDKTSSSTLVAVEMIDFRNIPRALHRHHFGQVIMILRGTGTHIIDSRRVPVEPGNIHVLAPWQTHMWDTRPGFSAITAVFSHHILEQYGPIAEHLDEIVHLGTAPIAITPEEQTHIWNLYKVLENTRRIDTAMHLTMALLWECVGAHHRRKDPLSNLFASELIRDFIKLAISQPRASRTVSSIATELGVTPGYLTEHVSRHAGTTPGSFMRHVLAREAQRYLVGTFLSVSEISSKLGFSTPSYFSRFFLREAGHSPSSYREIHRLALPPEP